MERPPTKAMMFLLNIANNPIKLVGAWFAKLRTRWLNSVIELIHILQQQKKEKEFVVFTFLHTIATKQEKLASLWTFF